jgi:hypothetical protein
MRRIQPQSSTETRFARLQILKESTGLGTYYRYDTATNGIGLLGALIKVGTSETYPSGPVVTTPYDGANRPNSVSGSQSGSATPYVSQIGYAPHGLPSGYLLGNNIGRVIQYNSRLQPSSIQEAVNNSPAALIFLETPLYGTGNNNGNVLGASVYQGGPGPSSALSHVNQTFTYDNLLGIGMGAILTGGAAGAGYGALAGGSSRTALGIPAATLPPAVSNPTLQSIVQKLFQATDVLPGGTAGAVRYEPATGDLMSPSGHSLKAQEVVTALTNLLKSGRLSFNDQIVSRQLIQDLSDALKTQPRR